MLVLGVAMLMAAVSAPVPVSAQAPRLDLTTVFWGELLPLLLDFPSGLPVLVSLLPRLVLLIAFQYVYTAIAALACIFQGKIWAAFIHAAFVVITVCTSIVIHSVLSDEITDKNDIEVCVTRPVTSTIVSAVVAAILPCNGMARSFAYSASAHQ